MQRLLCVGHFSRHRTHSHDHLGQQGSSLPTSEAGQGRASSCLRVVGELLTTQSQTPPPLQNMKMPALSAPSEEEFNSLDNNCHHTHAPSPSLCKGLSITSLPAAPRAGPLVMEMREHEAKV